MRHIRLTLLLGAFLIYAALSPRASAQLIETVAGNGNAGFTGDGVSPTSTEVNNPFGVVVDAKGNIYIADTGNNRIRVINTGKTAITILGVTIQPGTIQTVAGNGNSGSSGDGGAPLSASMTPYNLALDPSGNIYIADTPNSRVRVINTGTNSIKVGSVTIPAGDIETVAGNGSSVFNGDGIPATEASIYPWTIALQNGNIYIADTANNRIRVVNGGTSPLTVGSVTIAPGAIATVAGNGNYGIGGDGGSALDVEFEYPYGVSVDSNGNIYICDTYNRYMHVVNAGTSPIMIANVTIQPGNIGIVAGNGNYGFRGDGLASTIAEFADPDAIQLDNAGNFYISDTENARIREVNIASGIINTIAGTPTYGYSADGIPATSAEISYPRAIAFDSLGNLYFVDQPNERVREIVRNPGVPAITSRSSTAFTVGVQGNFTVTTADLPISAITESGSLPSGINFMDNGNGTASLYGTPQAATSSPIPITFTATNGVSPAAVQNFALTIYPVGGGPSASLVTEDTTTEGSWQGHYGADGYDLATATPSIPSYATFSISNQLNFTWTNSTTDPRALQIPGGSTGFAAAWYSNNMLTLDVNFTDGNKHQFALYAVDWDGLGRTETFQIVDVNSGVVLDTEAISNFYSGIYLVWNLSGHVQIYVQPTSGSNGVLSGVFFGGGGTLATPILTIAKTHSGNFTQGQNGTYSVTVSNLPNAASTNGMVQVTETIPSGLTLDSMTGTGWSCSGVSCNRSDPLGASASYQPITVTVTTAANASTPQVNQVAVTGGGSQRASASDSTTIVSAAGSAVVSSPSQDTQTEGAWQGKYGVDGYSLASVTPQVIPSYATFSVQNDDLWTWQASTNDPRALQVPGGTTGIAATWYNPVSFYFDVNMGGSSHPFAIYAVDWDSQGRSETVQVLDANTSAVLFSQQLTDFVGGVYLSWVITGHVHVTITTNGGPNCVVSGVFFGGGPNQETVTATGGASQSATVGSAFTTSLQATVQLGGSGVNGASVVFTAPSSGASGTFAGGGTTATVQTNSSGVATAPAFTANSTVGGPYTVTATVSGASGSASFSLSNIAAPVETVTSRAGTSQSATVGTSFTTLMQATVQLGGSGVNGASVVFTAPSSGASGTFAGGGTTATVQTNSSGVATAPAFTANSTVGGPYTVTATVSGVSGSASFALTNTAVPVETVTATGGTSQSATVGTSFTTLMQATVTSGGNPVNGASVVFTAPSSGASGTFAGGGTTATVQTNSSGVATAPAFTANSTVGGPYTVTATVSGVSGSASFSLTNTAPGASCSGPPCVSFVAFDSVTQGNWEGVYGANGYSLANVSSQIPADASFSVQSQLNYTWAPTSSDSRALEIPNGSGRTAATWYSPSPFSLDVSFTDGNTHTIALYALDWDNQGRAETFEVINPATNVILDIRTISNFTNGIYLVWNVSGSVVITVADTTGPNGVVSGIFFGTSGSVNVDVTPVSVNLAAGQTQQFGATVIGSTNQSVTWGISPAVGSISATGLYTAPSSISSSQTVGITAQSAATGSTLGTAIVKLTPGAVANFVTYNTSTEGDWPGVYGTSGYSLASVTPQVLPSGANISVQNAATYVWSATTSDPRALLLPGGSSGTAATWYSGSSFNISLSFNDSNTHQFELYAVDWDSKGRAETIQILDANTNAILDTRNISSFTNGIYLVWNISGRVNITVTQTSGANAVISGAFFQ